MVIWYIAKSYILLQCIFMSYMLILAWLILLLWIMMMYNPPDNVLSCLYLSMSLKKESSNFGPQGWPVHLHSGPGLRASDCRPQGTSALGKERGNTNGMCLMGLYNGICCRWDWMDNNYWDISVFILFPWDILSITSNGIATYFFWITPGETTQNKRFDNMNGRVSWGFEHQKLASKKRPKTRYKQCDNFCTRRYI